MSFASVQKAFDRASQKESPPTLGAAFLARDMYVESADNIWGLRVHGTCVRTHTHAILIAYDMRTNKRGGGGDNGHTVAFIQVDFSPQQVFQSSFSFSTVTMCILRPQEKGRSGKTEQEMFP